MCEPPRSWICLAGQSRVLDSARLYHVIQRIEIKSSGYIPDVYVRFEQPVRDQELFDDLLVIAHVMSELTALGYVGTVFDRAELGLQGISCIVLEPGREFRRFVTQKYLWRDLSRVTTTT